MGALLEFKRPQNLGSAHSAAIYPARLQLEYEEFPYGDGGTRRKSLEKESGTCAPACAEPTLLGIDEARASRLVAFPYSPTRKSAATEFVSMNEIGRAHV